MLRNGTGNALQGLIKGDVHYAKTSHSSASQASMSTVLSRVKKRRKLSNKDLHKQHNDFTAH